jgi:hypothetical protein
MKNIALPDIKDTVKEPANMSANDLDYLDRVGNVWEASELDTVQKLDCFTRYVSRQSLTKFMARQEIFARQLDIHGSIVEVGVHRGTSLMTWAHLSSILEPVNYLRKIIGFDTFEGFPAIAEQDERGTSFHLTKGGFKVETGAEQELSKAIELYDSNRLMNHLPKIELVRGDACTTIPAYLEANPHLVVSLLHLDADLYTPTKAALEAFLPRMPKGAIIAFDELNMDLFPGETLAVMETMGIDRINLKRFPYATSLSYTVL